MYIKIVYRDTALQNAENRLVYTDTDCIFNDLKNESSCVHSTIDTSNQLLISMYFNTELTLHIITELQA